MNLTSLRLEADKMIYDKLSEINRYRGIHSNIDTAIDYIKNHDLMKLSNGKYEIDGENVFVNVVSEETKNYENCNYEYHKSYIDLHIDLVGKEVIFVSLAKPIPVESFNSQSDGGLCTTENASVFTLGTNFIMCFPNEPHMPLIMNNQKEVVKKCIFKILYNFEINH